MVYVICICFFSMGHDWRMTTTIPPASPHPLGTKLETDAMPLPYLLFRPLRMVATWRKLLPVDTYTYLFQGPRSSRYG